MDACPTPSGPEGSSGKYLIHVPQEFLTGVGCSDDSKKEESRVGAQPFITGVENPK